MIEEFILMYKRLSHAYQAWGEFVASEIYTSIQMDPEVKENFLKVPIQKRLKKESSIRGKAVLWNFSDPQNDIRDLYGIRYVVLLSSEVRIIESEIVNKDKWRYEKSRDFGVESVESAETFDYQSVHYIITCMKDTLLDGVLVPAGISCEVQIRTMLQHAYAELTHDNIYKPSQLVPYSAKRLVARSMALMETTDDIFRQTLEELKKENLPRNQIYELLKKLYVAKVDKNIDLFDERINFEIIEFAKVKVNLKNSEEEISEFWGEQDGLYDKVKEQRDSSLLFRQPSVLLLYWLVEKHTRYVKKNWRFESMKKDIASIFSDLGIKFEGNL